MKFEQGLEGAEGVFLADTWNRRTNTPDERTACAKATMGKRKRIWQNFKRFIMIFMLQIHCMCMFLGFLEEIIVATIRVINSRLWIYFESWVNQMSWEIWCKGWQEEMPLRSLAWAAGRKRLSSTGIGKTVGVRVGLERGLNFSVRLWQVSLRCLSAICVLVGYTVPFPLGKTAPGTWPPFLSPVNDRHPWLKVLYSC